MACEGGTGYVNRSGTDNNTDNIDEENNINIRKTAMEVLKINTSSSSQWMECDVSYG